MSGIDTPWGDIRIHALPNGARAIKVEKAVKIDNTTVFLGADGKLYCPRLKDKCWYPVSDWGFSSGLMKGLVALGQITKKQADEYMAAAKDREARRSARYDLDVLDRIAAEHGLKIAARERAKLVKAAGGEA